jgi:hypothetical protein
VESVLLVNVSVVALPTNVSLEVGKVRVPVFIIEEKLGVVREGELKLGEVENTTFPEPVTPEMAVEPI